MVVMNPFLKIILNWTLIFSLLIFGLIFLVNWVTSGFFWKYLRVKGSRGKKLMVQVETMTDRYNAQGHIEEGFLLYKKRFSKEVSRLSMPDGAVYKYLGIYWVNVDEKKNAVMLADYSTVEGHDAELTEALYIRALNKPSMKENQTKILLILIILVLIFLLVIGILNVQILKAVKALVPAAPSI